LLLHVIDASHEDRQERIEHVNEVLAEIDAQDIDQIEIYNKIDLLGNIEPHVDYDESGQVRRIWLSSASGEGMDLLLDALKAYFGKNFIHCWLHLEPMEAKLRAQLYELGVVANEKNREDGGFSLEVSMQKHVLEQYVKDPNKIEQILDQVLAVNAN